MLSSAHLAVSSVATGRQVWRKMQQALYMRQVRGCSQLCATFKTLSIIG